MIQSKRRKRSRTSGGTRPAPAVMERSRLSASGSARTDRGGDVGTGIVTCLGNSKQCSFFLVWEGLEGSLMLDFDFLISCYGA